MTTQPLRNNGVYSVRHTPYQYVAIVKHTTYASAVLVSTPETKNNELLGGVPLIVLHTGRLIDSRHTDTGYTTADLDFTGRYLHAGHTFCKPACQEASDTEPSTGTDSP